MKNTMQRTAGCVFAVLAFAVLSGCATDDGGHKNTASNGRSNLDEADRSNHNSLLPASFYESNHLIDD